MGTKPYITKYSTFFKVVNDFRTFSANIFFQSQRQNPNPPESGLLFLRFFGILAQTTERKAYRMERIASFCINHDTLLPGMYLSRVDGDVFTYDLRFVRPNTPPYLPTAAMHTIEHLIATYVRNSQHKDGIIYFGPMGCRTGFYFLTRGLSHTEAIRLMQQALAFTADYEGAIPGASAVECGNWQEHDLPKARQLAAGMLPVLENYTEEQLVYPK